MAVYLAGIVIVISVGIFINFMINAGSSNKNAGGVIMMGVAGGCAVLLMAQSRWFDNFGRFISVAVLAAVILFVLYMLMQFAAGKKTKFKKQAPGQEAARPVAAAVKEKNVPKSSERRGAAVRRNPQRPYDSVRARTEEKENARPRRTARRIGVSIAEESVPAIIVTAGVAAETAAAKQKESGEKGLTIQKDVEILAREESAGVEDVLCESGKEDMPDEKEDSISPWTEKDKDRIIPEPQKTLEPETASQNTAEDEDEKEEGGSTGKAIEAELKGEAEIPASRDVRTEKRQAVLEKAALVKKQGMYLTAYGLFEAASEFAGEVSVQKSIRIEQLECLAAAGQYADASKSVFEILNKKYDLLPEEKEKIKTIMKMLQGKQGV